MRRDYAQCTKCGFGVDTEDLIYCQKCHSKFCCEKCGKPIFERKFDDEGDLTPDDDGGYDVCVSCVVCRGEFITVMNVLNYLLEKCKLTYKDAEKEYKVQLKKNKNAK